MKKRLMKYTSADHIIGSLALNRRMAYMATVAAVIVATVSVVVSYPQPVAADPGDDIDRMAVVSNEREAKASSSSMSNNGVPNPWGCRLEVDNPHESKDDPGPGNAQGKARIKCDTAPPPHVASIWQELSKWEGSDFTIEAEKTSYCPSGTGAPKCYPNLHPRPSNKTLMEAYINAPCEIGTTKRYVQIAFAELTVDGVTYSRLLGKKADVECEG